MVLPDLESLVSKAMKSTAHCLLFGIILSLFSYSLYITLNISIISIFTRAVIL